jgi:hypothetical protein
MILIDVTRRSRVDNIRTDLVYDALQGGTKLTVGYGVQLDGWKAAEKDLLDAQHLLYLKNLRSCCCQFGL